LIKIETQRVASLSDKKKLFIIIAKPPPKAVG